METIINNPGLQHLTEKVFFEYECWRIENLFTDLSILKTNFRKHIILVKEILKSFIGEPKTLENSSKENAIISYFQWNLKKEVVDLPCYSSPHVQDDFRKTILEAGEDDIELVKILVHLTILQFFGQQNQEIHKLSKYWPL